MNNKTYIYYFTLLIFACTSIYMYKTFVSRKFVIEGNSMYPSINNGDIIHINTISHKIKPITRNTIVVFELNNEIYCKRVIGLPGEEISIKDCEIYINDTLLTTTSQEFGHIDVLRLWIDSGQTEPFDIAPHIIPSTKDSNENHYFVIGDYILSSYDSRHFGPIPQSCIIGTTTKY